MKRINLIMAILVIIIINFSILIFGEEAIKNIEKSFAVNEWTKLYVKNVNGDVVVSSWDKNEIYIKANVLARDKEQLDNTFMKIEKFGNDIKVEVKYSEERYDSFWSFISYLKNLVRHSKSIVDIQINMPKKIDLVKIDTVNGDINVREVETTLKVETVNGEIELANVGKGVKAETVNGSIEVILNQLNEDVNLETVNGRIRLYLPSDAKANVRAANINGSIKTDFPLKIKGEIVGKNISGKIGVGGKKINCETVNGSIYILKK